MLNIFPPPSPTLNLYPFKSPILQQMGKINRIASGERYLWFATENGLAWSNTKTLETQSVPGLNGNITAVGVDPGGTHTWFSIDGVGIFSYTIGQTQVKRWDFQSEDQLDTVQTILVDMDGTGAWFGFGGHGVKHFTLVQGWTAPPSTSGLITPLTAAKSIVTDQEGGLWVNGYNFIYHLVDNHWDFFDHTSFGNLTNTFNAVLVDRQGRIWFGHSNGITVLVRGVASSDAGDRDWRQCSQNPGTALSGGVINLATSNNGQIVWVVTASGLAKIDLSNQGELSEDCRLWKWKLYNLDSGFKSTIWDVNTQKIQIVITEYTTDGGKSDMKLWVFNPSQQVNKLVNYLVEP
jgi:hypothetical protein